jgi:uncharacterized protein YceK
MFKYLLAALCTSAALVSTGCGSVMNVACDQPILYGGTITDVTVGAQWVGEGLGVCEAQSWFGGPLDTFSRIGLICGVCLDTPLSIVCDTLTIPYVAYRLLF